MSATPLVDACVINHTNIPYVNAEAARGIEIQLREEIGRLKDELTSVTKGSLELEEEKDELDRELQESDRRANSLERELAEAKIGVARYEYLRKLNPREFTALTLFCITADVRFDAEVDRRRNAK